MPRRAGLSVPVTRLMIMTVPTNVADRAETLLRLHEATEILTLVNCWDVSSARAAAAMPGATAIATASHAIADSYGYQDGEQISRDEMLAVCARIAAAVDLPLTADLEAGYSDAGETVRRAIGVGIVGANLEDQLKPLDESLAAVTGARKAAEAEGVRFVINARTDAYLKAPDRSAEDSFADAVERGRAYLDAGADCVFVPGVLALDVIGRLVDSLGQRKISIMNMPGGPTVAELQALGVARVSIGPFGQLIAIRSYAQAGAALLAGGGLPALD